MGSVTGADVVLTMYVPLVIPTAQQIQGFATDEVTDIPQLRSAEVMMGVDGILSSGFVYVPVPQTITLQADSESNEFFDTWWAQMQATKSSYRAFGFLSVPAISKKYALTSGALTGYKPVANVKRLLQPRTFEVTWQSIVPAPAI